MCVYNTLKFTKHPKLNNKAGRPCLTITKTETVHFGKKLVILFFNGLSEVKPEREKNKIVSRLL